jgi:NADP-dependent 3-hydroxy acid dehydrogenase YdfG
MLEVNVLGLCIATREAIEDMERRGVAGHVVHVSSMAGHRIPGPDSGLYAATKFAVRALTEALRQELRARKSPIRVTAVSPGHVLSEFAEVFTGRAGADQEIASRLRILEPHDVADAILWVVTRPPHVEVHDVLVRPTAQRN